MSVDLLFGTTNPGKLRELRRLVAGLPVRVVSPDEVGRPVPDVEEDAPTFRGNAERKAVAFARWSGLVALADDSGLCVDALGGRPGVHSARWSDLEPGPAPSSPVCELAEAAQAELGPVAGRAARDERNNDKLLAELAAVPDARRGAEYQAALSLARPDGTIVATVVGTCRGRIGRERRGTNGFGYDPLFVPEGEARTMAELPSDEKDARSHRGDAFRRILPIVARLARGEPSLDEAGPKG